MRWGRPSKDYELWHDWFAWHPVRCQGETAWLENIQRRWNWRRELAPETQFYAADWEYKFYTPLPAPA